MLDRRLDSFVFFFFRTSHWKKKGNGNVSHVLAQWIAIFFFCIYCASQGSLVYFVGFFLCVAEDEFDEDERAKCCLKVVSNERVCGWLQS
jgi:hypothetical protein